MYKWIKYYGYNVLVVATKKDKLTKNEVVKSEKIIRETLELGSNERAMFFSSLNKNGREELLNVLAEFIGES
jgi:GTP-binding protein